MGKKDKSRYVKILITSKNPITPIRLDDTLDLIQELLTDNNIEATIEPLCNVEDV